MLRTNEPGQQPVPPVPWDSLTIPEYRKTERTKQTAGDSFFHGSLTEIVQFADRQFAHKRKIDMIGDRSR